MRKIILGLLLAVAFASCKKEVRECPSSTTKEFSVAGFTRISAGETFSLKVKQGAAYSIKATGCSDDLNDLSISLQNGVLTIAYTRQQNNRYRTDFEISLPTLNGISLSGAASGEVTGFNTQTTAMRTTVSGTAQCTVNQVPALVRADLSGTGIINLYGNAPDLIATLSGNTRLNAYTAGFTDVDLYASGTARAYVQVQQSLAAFASGDSRIYYKGAPANVSIEQTGTAKVIHE